MGRTTDDYTPAEHFLREWLPDNRATVLDDMDQLVGRGLEVAYADNHSDRSGVELLALPRPAEGRAVPGRALAWLYAHAEGHHVRIVALDHVIGVELDEDSRETRLAIHVTNPALDLRFRSHSRTQRAWLRDAGEALQTRLLRG